ncbi:MAG: RHS repeat domain-containing protein, partial [Flammeovirgaceae bacterium]
METYRTYHDAAEQKDYIEREYAIYGSSRVGMYRTKEVIGGESIKGIQEGHLTLGSRSYELSNHLGNVLTVITDNKQMALAADSTVLKGQDGLVAYFQAKIVTANDYYPFGLSMEERKFEDESYRYGFNGMARDEDAAKNHYDFGARLYNPILGKWLAVDPSTTKYPYLSPYASFEDNPIIFIDPDGKDTWIFSVRGEFIGYIKDKLPNAAVVV